MTHHFALHGYRCDLWRVRKEPEGSFLSIFTLGKDHTEVIADTYDNQCGFNRPPKKTLPQSLLSGDPINIGLAVNSCFT